MSPLKKKGKKISVKKIKTFDPKNLNINISKLNPVNAIDGAKIKISNFYSNLKKTREKEKIRLEKKRKLDEKKNCKIKKRKLKKKD